MLRERIASIVIVAFWTVLAALVDATETALVQYTLAHGAPFWSLFASIVGLPWTVIIGVVVVLALLRPTALKRA